MFQNITDQEVEQENTKNNKKYNIKLMLKNIFKLQNIIIYIVSYMISTMSILDGIIVFPMAIFAAACSNGIVGAMVYVLTLLGTFFGQGEAAMRNYLATSIFFMILMILSRPRYQEDTKNEKRLLGKHLVLAIICMQAMKLFSGAYLIADLLTTVMEAILAYIFYKIFVNSIPVIQSIGTKKAFTLEEVIGASLLVSIAISSLHFINIYGVNVANVLCILLVLTLGWRNGALVGTTAGLTLGVTLGIIGIGENSLIVTYALSGLIAGILSRLGKIGAAIGIAIGIGVLAYTNNANIETGIYIKEMIIASIGLLIIPSSIGINIEGMDLKKRLLPVTMGNILAAGKQTADKLNGVSEAISEMAKDYEEAAATIVDEETDNIEKNKKIFKNDMLTSLEDLSSNILYDDLVDEDNGMLDEIFEILLKKEELTREDLIKVFENHNSYIVGVDDGSSSKEMENNIFQIVKSVNYTYKISKVNFVWQQKSVEEKKNMSNKLNVVSKVISNLADDIDIEEKQNKDNCEEIKILAKQKEINIDDIEINKQKNGKIILKLQTKKKDVSTITNLENILSKIFNEKIVYTNKNKEQMEFESEDKFKFDIGISKTTKNNSEASGDSDIETKLKDGKYLFAVSDGMGSGKIARNSSRRVLNMLERLLSSGFEKETSLELINTAMTSRVDDDMYATIDAMILDMYTGNVEFIKNGAFPTFIKSNKKVEVLKEASLPVGMSSSIKSVTYDKEIKKGDLIVMCTDGITESGESDWLKNLITKIQTDNVQKIADIIIKEAIDNNYGIARDDMTVIVVKIK